MADKTAIPQQPVISIRISDEMRSRLETLKEIMAAKSGEPVSTSEAAKQLLESAKEERLEFVDLLSDPTDSLGKIRGKMDAKLPLSHAEWTLVAYYCQQGAELFAGTGQTELSCESLIGILEAFLALYALVSKQRKKSGMAPYLLTNLPSEKQTEAKRSEEIVDEDLRRAVNRKIQMLKNPTSDTPRPVHTVRLLYMVLDNERFLNIEKLNETLRPYWPILWRVSPVAIISAMGSAYRMAHFGARTSAREIAGHCPRFRKANTVSNFIVDRRRSSLSGCIFREDLRCNIRSSITQGLRNFGRSWKGLISVTP